MLGFEISRVYSTGAMYYYKKKNYKKALDWVNKGLEYNPNDLDLKKKKKTLAGAY